MKEERSIDLIRRSLHQQINPHFSRQGRRRGEESGDKEKSDEICISDLIKKKKKRNGKMAAGTFDGAGAPHRIGGTQGIGGKISVGKRIKRKALTGVEGRKRYRSLYSSSLLTSPFILFLFRAEIENGDVPRNNPTRRE